MENLCMNCMESAEDSRDICPHCGEPLNEPQITPFIPKKTTLTDRYIVGKGIEMDGEGLSYIGYDMVKETKIYIREFYPSNFCTRTNDFTKVQVLPDSEKLFKGLLIEFLKYFRSIARLRNLPAIMSVYDIFEENNTAYIICEWIDGTQLDKYISSKGGFLNWDEAKIMFMPLLSSLSHMEACGIRHLGICPQNILVTPENKLRLTGFATKSLRSVNSLINSQLYDGCSAIEQYLDDYKPSESTDVYGFTASLFLALTGEYPLAAPKRRQNDKLLMPQNVLDNLPENVVSAIATALRVYPNNRTLSFENLGIELSDSPLLRVKNMAEPGENFSYEHQSTDKDNKKSNGIIWGIISCVFALILLLVFLGIYWFWWRDNAANQQSRSSGTQSTSQDEEDQTEETSKNDDSAQTKEKIAVPDLIGRNFKNLQEELSSGSSKYRVVLLSEEFHDTIGEGCIISQTPNYGEEMEVDSTIAVNVSKGSKKRILPDVMGKTLSEASQLVTNAKLVPTAASEFSNDFAEGTVIGYKNHKAGDTVDYGSEVVIIVSKGMA